jgi:hypothetical protein
MKILVACEESQEVTKAFRALGHEAYSCDVEPCSGGHPEWHFERDVKDLTSYEWLLTDNQKWHWDMIIAFPPCTYLSGCQVRWLKDQPELKSGKPVGLKRRLLKDEAIDFFMWFINHPCPKIAIENPIGIMSTKYRKPDQIIQPWQFGHGETKATCLWLKGLPKLTPTNIVEGREQRIWKMPPSKDRAKLRSKTYTGIAQAMAEQWGVI